MVPSSAPRPSEAMIRTLPATLVVAALLAGCSRPDYDTTDATTFQASCVDTASRLSGALAVRGFDPKAAAAVLLMSVKAPTYPEIPRRFDPGQPPAAAGAEAFAQGDVASLCAQAAPLRSGFEGVGAWASLDVGLAHWLSSLNSQAGDVRDAKNAIRAVVEGRRVTSGRLSDLISTFAPQGVGYSVQPKGGRMVPTVVVDAVNPLDKAIQAMFLAIDLKRPDGSILASGRLTFTPAVPLAPGVEARYSISLDGVAGFSSPALADLRSNVTVGVKVEDVVSDNVRLLNDTLLDPQDVARIDTLAIVQGRIDDYRAFVRNIRQREAAVR